ncbi:nuclear transport factor 2 family protein [Nocardia vermiculata]|uniref:Nuclear transport factor 2 family protein n=1 Tax=Nocardia vermiculata TaxID=257274 RepID=A0A846XW56_9NOCA|nr:nuclear transport factor 2 family protein [Nocardia vermiculata]NKY49621.1 nuclear transport factor 2 family protein [Nocardia vermiculata]
MTELAELQRRLAKIEDERAIERMIASYGPLVDSGNVDGTARMWAEDGTYDVEDWQMRSRADVADMVASELHQGLIGTGCLHFHGPAVATVDGDEAVAVCESILVVRHKERNIVARTGANHFQLRRIDGHWQITARVTRTIDGDPEARALLTAGIEGKSR